MGQMQGVRPREESSRTKESDLHHCALLFIAMGKPWTEQVWRTHQELMPTCARLKVSFWDWV